MMEDGGRNMCGVSAYEFKSFAYTRELIYEEELILMVVQFFVSNINHKRENHMFSLRHIEKS